MADGGALTKKNSHPWREHFQQQTVLRGGAVRSAAITTTGEEGLSGEIHRHKVHLGSLQFLEQNGVHCDQFVLEVKRWQRSGYQVECLTRDTECLGVFLRSPVRSHPEFSDAVRQFRNQGLQVGVIGNSLHVDRQALFNAGVDTGWLGMDPAEAVGRMAKLRRQGGEVLLFGGCI